MSTGITSPACVARSCGSPSGLRSPTRRPPCSVARRSSYRVGPFGQPGVRAVASFDTVYENVDVLAFTDLLELDGIRLVGRASGRNLLEWPLGRFSDHRGDGEIRLETASPTLSRFMTASEIDDAERRGREWGPLTPDR